MSEPARRVAVPQPKQNVPGEERRRSQRVIIRVPVKLHVTLQNQITAVPGETVIVNDHGAMILAKRGFPPGTRMELVDERTGAKTACRMTRPSRETSEGFQIAVEFEKPEAGFWRIYFPPADSAAQ